MFLKKDLHVSHRELAYVSSIHTGILPLFPAYKRVVYSCVCRCIIYQLSWKRADTGGQANDGIGRSLKTCLSQVYVQRVGEGKKL